MITHSSNIGAAKIALTLPNDHLYDLFKRFGFGESTGSGFPGEAAGALAPPNKWGPVEKATMSYGYGLSVTPLQLAQAYGGLANGGRLRAPAFVKGAQNPESAVLGPDPGPHHHRHARNGGDAAGLGVPKAAVRNYRVAGKTGTSRKAVAGGYESRYISTFKPVSCPHRIRGWWASW
ncbi:penicillin-binding transpeptidase domain-containing protein [Paucibacter sp. O1-1]|nr:penicillin-binding transpeptidase domain-containing protein [Paucibacter sp. O1-1]MDA3831367.1 penicillin-binding transpeptidase domain-containing protein [Paucibacter sp. O1-1]